MLNVLIKPLWIFGIDRVVQNRVGYERYGVYFSYLGLCVSLGFLSDAGLTALMGREMARGHALNIKSILRHKFLLSLLYIIIICFIGFISGLKDWSLLLPLLIIQVLTSYLIFYRGIITAQQFFNKDAWLSVLDKALLIVCCGLLLYTPLYLNFTLHVFLYLQVGALLVALMVAVVLSDKAMLPEIKTETSSLLFKAAPYMVLILLMSMHNRLDAFLLGRFHADGAYQSGVYAASYRLLDAGNVFGYLMASYLVAFAARNLGNKNLISEVSFTLRQALLFGSFVLLAFVGVYASEVQQILYPSLAPPDPNVLVLCIAALPAYYLIHIYGSLLTAQGALKPFICIVAFSLLVNLVANAFLLYMGAVGCCIAALISQYVCAIACMISCRMIMKVELNILSLGAVGFSGMVYWALFYFMRTGQFSLQLSLAVAMVLTALLMFAWWQRIKWTLSYT